MAADYHDQGQLNYHRCHEFTRLEAEAMRGHVQENPDRQSRRDCLPDHQDGAPHGHQARSPSIPTPTLRRSMSRWPTRRSPSVRRPRRSPISTSRRSSTPARQTGAEAVHPGYGFLSERVGLPARARRGRHRLHRPQRRGHRCDGRQDRLEEGGGRGRRLDRARPSRHHRERRRSGEDRRARSAIR